MFLIAANYSVFSNPKTSIIITLYIDDVLITGPNRTNIQRIKDALNAKFHIINLELYVYYLGIIVTRDRVNQIIRLR